MKQPLLSIVVPTKDRYPYLKHLVQMIHGFDSDEIEIIVQDNTEDNSVFVNSTEINYVKYFYEKEQIPIYQNCDKAILHSNGEFVCFIGDDDGVTEYVIECAKWMKKNDVEVVMPSTISYSWPDRIVKSKTMTKTGAVVFRPFSGKITKVSTKEVLQNSIDSGFINRGNMPLVYHGIVKRTTLDRIFDKCGTFFPGASPDIANAVALCLSVDEFYKIDVPLTISGASKTHGGGVNKMKNRAARIEDVSFLPKDITQTWDERVPRIWTGETIWCQSALMAIKAMGRNELLDQVAYEKLYARFAAFHLPLRRLAYSLTSNKFKLTINIFRIVIYRYINAGLRYAFGLFGSTNGQIVKTGNDTIKDAVKVLIDEYPKCNLN